MYNLKVIIAIVIFIVVIIIYYYYSEACIIAYWYVGDFSGMCGQPFTRTTASSPTGEEPRRRPRGRDLRHGERRHSLRLQDDDHHRVHLDSRHGRDHHLLLRQDLYGQGKGGSGARSCAER